MPRVHQLVSEVAEGQVFSHGSVLSTLPSGPPPHVVSSPALITRSSCMEPGASSHKCPVQPLKPVFISPKHSQEKHVRPSVFQDSPSLTMRLISTQTPLKGL